MSQDEHIAQTIERENLTLAPFSKRIWAFLIDSVLLGIGTLLAIITLPNAQALQNPQDYILSLMLQAYAIDIIYQTIFTYKYGATLGKIACKIQVIDTRLLDAPNLPKSILRSVLRALSQTLYYIPFLFAFGDSLRRTLHDRASGTIVINQKN